MKSIDCMDLALLCAGLIALCMVAVRLWCAVVDPDSAWNESRAQAQEQAWDRAELQP